jgi:hypothetical protein
LVQESAGLALDMLLHSIRPLLHTSSTAFPRTTPPGERIVHADGTSTGGGRRSKVRMSHAVAAAAWLFVLGRSGFYYAHVCRC